MKHLLGCCLVLATTALAVLPGDADRVRALAERVAADLADTADEIRAALERLAEESKDGGHYTRGEDN
jgi:hypothetical protein